MGIDIYKLLDEATQHLHAKGVRDAVFVISAKLANYVITPKGANPYPFADALHEMAERPENVEYLNYYDVWQQVDTNVEYRIKPVVQYECKVRMALSNGEYTDTDRYFTEEEFSTFGFPNTCFIIEDSVRIRK